jgi:predicted  nucleic acid-binding Zn-ribbon protein
LEKIQVERDALDGQLKVALDDLKAKRAEFDRKADEVRSSLTESERQQLLELERRRQDLEAEESKKRDDWTNKIFNLETQRIQAAEKFLDEFREAFNAERTQFEAGRMRLDESIEKLIAIDHSELKSHYQVRLSALHGQLDSTKGQLESIKELLANEKMLRNSDAQRLTTQANVQGRQKVDEYNTKVRQLMSEHASAIAQLQSDRNTWQESYASSQNALKDIMSEHASAIAQLQSDCTTWQESYASSQNALKDIMSEHASAIAQLQSDCTTWQESYASSQNALKDTQNDLSASQSETKAVKSQLEDLKREHSLLKRKSEDYDSQCQQLRSEIHQINHILIDLLNGHAVTVFDSDTDIVLSVVDRFVEWKVEIGARTNRGSDIRFRHAPH